MKKKNEKLVYGVYYRKSSEADDRQAQSIPDQIRDTDTLIKKEGLVVGMKFPGESQTAHTIGRPVFGDMVQAIMNGKINAILVWHANRLARNPVDAGMLLYLMDEGKLKEIRTLSRTYRNGSNDKFLLQLDFSISKKDSDEKSEIVIRALEGRAKRGLPNGVAHIGYLNDKTQEKGNRGWIKDPVRYPLVKKLLDMMLTGKYTVRELYEYAKNDLKLSTIQRKNTGGRPMALSYMYTFFRDPIHGGFFFQETDGENTRYEFTAIKPMITEDEYWKIQSMLGKRGVPRVTKHTSTYSRFATCGTCHGPLSADFKFQVVCTGCKRKFSYLNMEKCPGCDLPIDKMVNPKFLTYVFHYCLNNKKHRTVCPGNGIEERSLEKQLSSEMEKLALSKDLAEWCIKNISTLKDEAFEGSINVQNNLMQEKQALDGKLGRLTMLRISKDHSAEEEAGFDVVEKKLREELSLIELKLSDTNVDWFSEAKKDFNLMSEITDITKEGTVEQKKDLLHTFRSNLTVSAKILSVTNKKSIEAFKSYLLLAVAENEAFEPKRTLENQGSFQYFALSFQTLLRG